MPEGSVEANTENTEPILVFYRRYSVLFSIVTKAQHSAVAEMGDCGHKRHGPKRGELLCPFRRSCDLV